MRSAYGNDSLNRYYLGESYVHLCSNLKQKTLLFPLKNPFISTPFTLAHMLIYISQKLEGRH
ncbi:MAG: hypothetical protein A2Z09_00695 [Nitrospirae bacterium RBG_16_43_8]|nr:MAG: hypothetical protein A2Z09_00695 [Nitrospirae bacterium RBG_16_43_8]